MPKITLQFEGIVLKECVVGPGVTIGRLPDNDLIIDNPAVSGHHARVFPDGDQMILEDLKSTNGTFVRGQLVTRHVLQPGDEALVGKHHIVFDAAPDESLPAAAAVIQGLGDTVYLDTKQHRALRATLEATRVDANKAAYARQAAKAAAPRRVGVLRVVSGRADQDEYDLEAHTSIIGRSASALVHLRGWFKPAVAVAIARSGDDYVATLLGGKTLVNGQPLTARYHLKDGDILNVSGLTLEFHWKGDARAESAA
jgi:pSer/pThr/pTyr-binding forkhead associated (FHA) protein